MSHSSYSLLSALRQFASIQLKSCERDEQKKQIIDNNGVPTTIIDLVGVCLVDRRHPHGELVAEVRYDLLCGHEARLCLF